MLSLLVEFGADLLAKDPILPITPLQWLLSGRLQTDDMLGILLKGDQPDQVYIEALHRTFRSQLIELQAIEPSSPRSNSQAGKERQYRVDLKEQFRRVLTHPRLVRYIDSTEDEHGATLIQQAAYVLHSSSVRLLLDAGADAGRAFHHGSYSALPLQIAYTQARGLYAAKQQLLESFSESSRRRAGQAMEVAKELLKWHVARGDGVFHGITELHLACRMADGESMVELLSLGMDPRAKGRWPGVEQEVTPRELLRLELEADMEVVLNFPVPSEQDDAERPIPQAMDLLFAEFSGEEYDSSSVNTEDLEL
ncbi:uncharacterized protein DNG_02225 [Cephalotrichum gorgonifer]|uniref:Uncharacterized protein n=1 Tax=Cephalotrichum gorgonifer TaxID=2041049 RepID=A0AAE8MSM1_9PEZI|nr:uncharacterized protein DNG_02225 [Cephalotrichum gorgonifer]